MKNVEFVIRVAVPDDAEELVAIYDPYVRETAVSFEYETPSADEFRKRMIRTLVNYPYLKAVCNGEIIGYAYASPFHQRAAYAWGVESSVYVRQDKRMSGVGRALYAVLEKALLMQHVLNVNACIASTEKEDEHLNPSSICFHQRMGYRMVGEFSQCGYKFGRWYNMVWMEKHLAVHPDTPAAFLPFPQVRAAFEKQL